MVMMVVRLEGVEERLCEWGERERGGRERGEERSGRKYDSVMPYRVLYMFSLFLS